MKRALIIDDDPSFAKLLEKRLCAIIPGLVVTLATTLESTRALLRKESSPFDLVLLDQHLPDGRGLDLLNEGWFESVAVLSVSSDNSPEIPGEALKAGAMYFLEKRAIAEPLFKPLVLGILDRNILQQQLALIKATAIKSEVVKTLVGTLRHEINNPLGAVLGAAYLLQHQEGSTPQQRQAAALVEESGKRIKHVLDQLCDALSLEPVIKAHQEVYHIPGDAPWDSGKPSDRKKER